jgi:hypothetical protein
LMNLDIFELSSLLWAVRSMTLSCSFVPL